ncbi:PREDICTED: transcription factor SPEECHLESS [Tarenaya hassleriana]|uniref:transcription factor SPEECHLESS n=1 Tax=Tarenaya hassleriana TaxID=28532 RepID=UPI00053C222D|nr:PREDICTED: transcription factor SPEECHLESS [Tarenaya hassleriana]
MHETLPDFLEECEFADTSLAGDDLFAILESLEGAGEFPPATASTKPLNGTTSSTGDHQDEISPPVRKRQKLEEADGEEEEEEYDDGEEEDKKQDGQTKMSHITVERNRRKQMNEHLSVLRSLMPCFYVKRGDQASIIGGVVEYISELQQVLQSLEAKKQRKAYAEVLSPRLIPSPRPSPTVLSPRKPPLSPRLLHHHHHLIPPISPRTPQPLSPYRSLAPPPLRPPHHPYHGGGLVVDPPYSPSSSSSPSRSVNSGGTIHGHGHAHHESGVINELVANSKSAVAEVEVKFSGANVLLKTVSHRIPGQAVKIISALEDLALEILQVNINTVDETMLNSFTIKIGIECQLSAEELAQQIQQTFC